MSCNSEINPKWEHAIDTNICPFCGKDIMDVQLREVLQIIGSKIGIVEKVGHTKVLDDWLLANFNYIKTDSKDLIKYVDPELLKAAKKEPISRRLVKVRTDKGEEEVVSEQMQDNETTNDFFKRAEAVKPNIDGFKSAAEKTQHLKNLARQIKKAGTASMTGDGNDMITAEMLEGVDPEAVAEMSSLMSDEPAVSSALQSSDGDDEVPDFVLEMANRAKAGGSNNAKDLLKLQEMHRRQADSSENFKTGSKGAFSRSG